MPQPFNIAVMTNDGARLLTGAQTGEHAIQFTRIAVGSGLYSDDEKTIESLQARSDLKELKNIYAISNKEVYGDRAVKVTALITNQNPVTKEALVSEGYYINEMGLYAKPAGLEGGEEVLYSIVVTSGKQGDFMPPYNGYNPVQITQDYYITVNNSGEVTIETGTGAAALAEDLEKLREDFGKLLDAKQDAETGKGLSTEDYTTEDKEKLAGVEEGANKTVVDSELSSESENPVRNKTVKAALDAKGAPVHIGMTAPSDPSALWVKTDFEV